MRVLNVGGQIKAIPLPDEFKGWESVLLDIDESVKPDVVADARNLFDITDRYEAVYCSHVLEHFHKHEVPKVLNGFRHVLSDKGFVYIRVPDIEFLVRLMATEHVGLEDGVYMAPAGIITPIDMIYGFQKQIEVSGQEYFSHKMGFSLDTLTTYLDSAGFKNIEIKQRNYELVAIAFI